MSGLPVTAQELRTCSGVQKRRHITAICDEKPGCGNHGVSMRLVALGVMAVAMPAAARPASPHAEACPVTVVRAPDEVRAIVDAWVRTEPRCGAALEVTIEVAEGGFVLTARDARGGRRVREVPDAQTAGVLIASWAADDRFAAPAPGAAMARGVDTPSLAAAASPPGAAPHRRAQLTGVVGNALGVRGEVDVLGHRITFGLALALQTSTIRVYGVQRDLQAIEYVGFTHAWSRWQLRTQLGVGVQVTDLQLYNEAHDLWAAGFDTLFVTEASVTLSRALGAGWAVTGGALISVLPSPTHTIEDMSVVTDLARISPVALLGVSYAL
jgi:hypothetical protein